MEANSGEHQLKGSFQRLLRGSSLPVEQRASDGFSGALVGGVDSAGGGIELKDANVPRGEVGIRIIRRSPQRGLQGFVFWQYHKKAIGYIVFTEGAEESLAGEVFLQGIEIDRQGLDDFEVGYWKCVWKGIVGKFGIWRSLVCTEHC